jgi:hypothetical protein
VIWGRAGAPRAFRGPPRSFGGLVEGRWTLLGPVGGDLGRVSPPSSSLPPSLPSLSLSLSLSPSLPPLGMCVTMRCCCRLACSQSETDACLHRYRYARYVHAPKCIADTHILLDRVEGSAREASARERLGA